MLNSWLSTYTQNFELPESWTVDSGKHFKSLKISGQAFNLPNRRWGLAHNQLQAAFYDQKISRSAPPPRPGRPPGGPISVSFITQSLFNHVFQFQPQNFDVKL